MNVVITLVFCIHFWTYDCRLHVDYYVNTSSEIRGIMFFQLCSALSASIPSSLPALLLRSSGRHWMQVTVLPPNDAALKHQVTFSHVPCYACSRALLWRDIQLSQVPLIFSGAPGWASLLTFLPYWLGITVLEVSLMVGHRINMTTSYQDVYTPNWSGYDGIKSSIRKKATEWYRE